MVKQIVAVLMTVALSVTAIGAASGAASLPVVTSAPIPVQSGFDGSEQFCGTIGVVQYVALKSHVKLRVHFTALRANRQYSIVWRNNAVRGYTIGAFSTTSSGSVRKGSLRLFRPGEVRGIGIEVYFLVGLVASGVERFAPCEVVTK